MTPAGGKRGDEGGGGGHRQQYRRWRTRNAAAAARATVAMTMILSAAGALTAAAARRPVPPLRSALLPDAQSSRTAAAFAATAATTSSGARGYRILNLRRSLSPPIAVVPGPGPCRLYGSVAEDHQKAEEKEKDHSKVEEITKDYDTEDDDVIAHVVPRNFVPVPFQYREELTLRVESLTNLGLGICRATHLHDGADPHPDENDPLFASDPFHGLATSGDESEEDKKAAGEEGPGTGDNGVDGGGGGGKRARRRRRRRRGKRGNNNSEEALPPEVQDAVSHGGGWVVMVPNVIPGELVKCRVFRNKARYSEADLIEVVEPSPERVEPKCELFDRCGGCQYQHMSIGKQREWKRRQVEELFERVGKFTIQKEGSDDSNGEGDCPEVLPTLGTDEIYHYRSKITPHYDRPSVDPITTIYSIDAMGFKEKTSRRIVDVPYCHIATEPINAKLTQYREEKFKEAKEGRLRKPTKGATLLLRDAHDLESGEAKVCTDPNEYVLSTVDGVEFKFQAGNFFQNNPFVLPLMVERVTTAAMRPNAHTGQVMTHLIDCYCGSGLFSLTSSAKFDVCVGIEVNEKAVGEATANAERNNVQNCKFVAASAEAIFASSMPVEVTHSSTGETRSELVRDFPRDTTVVVIDPPRKGCSIEFLAQLAEYKPRRVVYMSCDPATQARDARVIADAGYEVTSVEPVDLFPQTRHIECLAVFERS